MAEGKKDVKKPAGGDDSQASIGFVFFALLILVLVIIPSIVSFFGLSFGWIQGDNWTNVKAFTVELLSDVLTSISFLSIFCIFIFAIGLYYAKFQRSYVMEEYERKIVKKFEPAATQNVPFNFSGSGHRPTEKPLPHNMVAGFPGTEIEPLYEENKIPQFGELPKEQVSSRVVNPRWEEVKTHIASHSPSEWRIAIMEADILLYEMLDQMGYQGSSIADKLKQVDKASFQTIDCAWRAHRVRNMIAHQGNTFEISRYEAEKTIKLYQQVFQEFYFI